MAYNKLEVLRFHVGVVFLRDHTEVPTSIATLRCLEVAFDAPEEIEFLQADESTVDPPLASLDAVITIHTHRGAPTSSSDFCKIYGSIPSSGSNFKRFCIEGADVGPLLVFQEPGQESRHAQLVSADLEYLSLILSWPTSSNKTIEEMYRRWDAVFIQIDKLEHLKSLSIESEDLGEYPQHGFLQYCYHLLHLKSLFLVASRMETTTNQFAVSEMSTPQDSRLGLLEAGFDGEYSGEYEEEDGDKKNEGYSEYNYGLYEDDAYMDCEGEEYEE
ncbi:hypothetical protein BGX20_003366, partial [Mortierella sp. AD010]